ncbi:LysR substrate-binding domain-containing protein [Pseudomonas fildesensis]|uniref:LysR substrate-binding domain-containing protein n=1 Tax=Pseudomonas fildesensis TaxID=1674920 RepID=UPI0009E4272F
MVQERVDCVIRTRELDDSKLVARQLDRFRWVTCASVAYLEENGTPQTLQDLSRHRAIHYFSGCARQASEMHFARGTKKISVPMSVRPSIMLAPEPKPGNAAHNLSSSYLIKIRVTCRSACSGLYLGLASLRGKAFMSDTFKQRV